MLLTITRSVGVICLSQYLQVTLTGYETLKHSNHLSTNYLYRDRDKALAHHDGKYCAIPACHRDSFSAHNRDKKPAGCASNANSLNCRAVGCNGRDFLHQGHGDISRVAYYEQLPSQVSEYIRYLRSYDNIFFVTLKDEIDKKNIT